MFDPFFSTIGHDFRNLSEVIIKYNSALRLGQKDYVELFLNYYKKWLHKQKANDIPLHIINHIGRETIKIELEDRIATNVRILQHPYKWYPTIEIGVLEKLNGELRELDWTNLYSIENEVRSKLQLRDIVQSLGNYNGQ